jgi:hypothetical protein
MREASGLSARIARAAALDPRAWVEVPQGLPAAVARGGRLLRRG